MSRVDQMLKPLIEPISDPVSYCPTLYSTALQVAELEMLALQQSEEPDEEALADAQSRVEAATETVEQRTFQIRFRHLGETEHDNLRTDLDVAMSALRTDPARRQQARKLILDPLEPEPKSVLIDTLLQMHLEGRQYPTKPDQIAHPQRQLELAAEAMRPYLAVLQQFGDEVTLQRFDELIDQLEFEAAHTDFEPHMKAIGLVLTQQDESELAILDDGSPMVDEQLRQRKREMYDRAIAVICEGNQKTLDEYRAELDKQSRSTLEHQLLNKTLDSLAGRFARTQYVNVLLCRMAEVFDDTSGEWLRLFTDEAEVDRLATGKGEGAEFHAWLCEQMAEMLPRKESQLVMSARFRDALDNGDDFGERVLAGPVGVVRGG